MAQKISPTSNRLPITKNWQSRWFAGRNYASLLLADLQVREFLDKRYRRQAALGKVEIKRTVGGQMHIILHTAKPGIIIGRSGSGLAELRRQLEHLLGFKGEKGKPTKKTPGAGHKGEQASRLKIDIVEIKTPEQWARLVADSIADQLERRIGHRRAIRQAMERVMQAGAKGIRVRIAGRLGGAEISRVEKFTQGSVPLSTFRADISYDCGEAQTTYGTIGIQVWIHRGELVENPDQDA